MSFQVLAKYAERFPAQTALIQSFQQLYDVRLWNQLSMAILGFLFDSKVKGRVEFDFYTEFVKKFQKNIDQIKLLKIIREVIVSLSNENKMSFLKQFQEKQAFTEQTKTIVQALQGIVYVNLNFNACSELIHRIEKTLSARKDVDQLVYSVYYEFCMGFFKEKRKYKSFYTSALQYLAYTPSEEIQENQKITMLVQMAVAALASKEIYNFSQLLEQPSLVSLKNSSAAWMYELLEIFNKGDIAKFQRFDLGKDKTIVENKKILDEKIRIMAFLELVFNLPKNDRVIKFNTVSKQCSVNLQNTQFMVMKAMALNLVKGSIDQLTQQVTINWVAPKVLQNQRIGVMMKKFQEWDQGVDNVYTKIKENFKFDK